MKKITAQAAAVVLALGTVLAVSTPASARCFLNQRNMWVGRC